MKFTFFLFALLLTINSFGQTDTTKTEETYDIIYLRDGSVLKGQILSFDPSDGDITFVDMKGVKYFLTSADYKSFQENVVKKKKRSDEKTFELKPRKETEFDISVGFSIPFFGISGEKQNSETLYVENFYRAYVPLCFNIGIGKYFGRQHFVGLNLDIAANTTANSFFTTSLRYAHQYDANKRNLALYIPIEAQFNHFRDVMPYRAAINDTSFFGDGGYSISFPKTVDLDASFNSAGVSLGHGFSFILNNKHAISAEVMYFKTVCFVYYLS